MNKISKLVFMFVIAFSFMAPIIAHAAPSFSCKGRLTSNEQLICNSAQLSGLDKKIVKAFYSLTAILNRGAADIVRADQRLFLKNRQNCRRKFRCTRLVMQARLDELAAQLAEQQDLRASPDEGLNEEELNDNPCGPGFTQAEGKCIHNSDVQLQKSFKGLRTLPSGKYGIYVLAHGDSLRVDSTADKLLYTQGKSADPGAPKQPFFVIFQNGAYTITDDKSGLRLHSDGGGDRQVSVRYQPHDNFTKFRLIRANEGCFYVRTLATGNYWLWEPNTQVIVVSSKPAGEESMFCFMAQ